MKQLFNKDIPMKPVLKLFLFTGLVWATIVGPISSVIILFHLGASAPQIGIFTAIGAVVAMVCQPIWGYFSDKIRSPRLLTCLCLIGSAIFFSSIWFTESFYIAMILLLFETIFRSSIIALLDSHTLSEMKAIPGLQYSHIRMAGSLFYGLTSLFYSMIINAFGVMTILPISFLIAISAACWGLIAAKGQWEKNEMDGGHRAKVNLKKEALSLFKNKGYILFVIFVAFNALAVMPLFVFSIEYVSFVGGKPGDVPMIHFLRCMMEIPFFILIGAIGNRISTKMLLIAGICFSFIYLFGLLLATNLPILVVAHMIGSIGFILTLSGRMRYLRETAPEAVLSTSITVMGAFEIGVGSIAGNLIAGMVLGLFGTRAFTLISISALCIAMILLIFLRTTSPRQCE